MSLYDQAREQICRRSRSTDDNKETRRDLYTRNLEKKNTLFDQPENTGWLFIDQPRNDQLLAEGILGK
jgi:hypothetical protein